MRYLAPLAVIAMLFAMLLPLSVVAQTDAPPGPATRHLSRTDGLPVSGEYEIVQWVLDFAPGAWSPVHTHGGKVLTTVLQGELTRRADGTETVYKTGDSFVEMPNHPHQAGNPTDAPVSLWATAVLPKGAALTTVAGTPSDNPPPGPVTRYIYREAGWAQTGPYEIVQLILDFAPGASTPPHTHGGVLLSTILAGELTLRMPGHDEMVYKPGENFVEHPGHVRQAANTTSAAMTVAVSTILPKGNAITYVLPSMDCLAFTETKQSLCFGFKRYWEAYGGLAVFGYPITGEFKDSNGVTVQWFERARFEWQPGAWPERFDVMLGRIGSELVEMTGVGPTP